MTDSLIPYFQEEEEEEEKEEERPRGGLDFNAKLLKTRTIILADVINKKMSQRVISQLLLLEQEDPKKDIKVFIYTKR
ncbi:MAG TPA: ATP-dependent Clp protease proteolytic subunit [Candidatus Hypogeohydataceae bacterium YC40]